jgi:glutamate racemase
LDTTQVNISQSPIGIFDSGLGGLSICKEIMELLPNELIIYLADSKNAPYGEKTKEQIIQFSIKNTELLIDLGCKIIVVACNTATTNAIKTLRSNFSIPFIGIEPATKPAALTTQTGKIGVLATKGTLNSDLFITTSSQFKHIEIIETEGKNLVKLIEAGKLDETKPLLEKYLLPMVEKGVDNIVLGCTHYPFLIPLIKSIIPNNVKVIDSGAAVAKQTATILEQKGLLNHTTEKLSTIFYTNKELSILDEFIKNHGLKAGEISFKAF